MASFTASAPVEGLLLGMSGLPPVTSTTRATMPTRVNIQPEHVAQALHEPALGREQQDHRRQRDGLEGDHEPDQEQVKQQLRTPGRPGRAEPTRHAACGKGTRTRPHMINGPSTQTQRRRQRRRTTEGQRTTHGHGRISGTAKKPVDAWWLSLGPPRVDRFARGCPPQPPVASTPQFPHRATTYSAGDKRTRSRRGLGTQPTMKRRFPVRDRAGSVAGELRCCAGDPRPCLR